MGYLWIPTTLIASVAQTARNAMQRSLTETIGTVGATQVRFLYGFPFALLFLARPGRQRRTPLPARERRFCLACWRGAVTQILATALMLAAMRERSFAVDDGATSRPSRCRSRSSASWCWATISRLGGVAAIVIATAGVVLMAWSRARARLDGAARPAGRCSGIVAGAFFALSAVGFRGAILSLDERLLPAAGDDHAGLVARHADALLLVWLGAVRPAGAVRRASRAWRPRLLAGFLGAFASQFWFIGFSLTAAANVRTLALVEVLMARPCRAAVRQATTAPRDRRHGADRRSAWCSCSGRTAAAESGPSAVNAGSDLVPARTRSASRRRLVIGLLAAGSVRLRNLADLLGVTRGGVGRLAGLVCLPGGPPATDAPAM